MFNNLNVNYFIFANILHLAKSRLVLLVCKIDFLFLILSSIYRTVKELCFDAWKNYWWQWPIQKRLLNVFCCWKTCRDNIRGIMGLKKFLSYHFYGDWILLYKQLTHFIPIFHLYSLWKRQKTKGFLTFARGTEMAQWAKMVKVKRILYHVSWWSLEKFIDLWKATFG